MSLLDFKFNESDFIGKKIGDLSDTPSSDGMTAEALKAYFDYIPKTMIALGAVNNIIDLLVSSAGAESIGANVSGVTGTQVQSILESVKTMLDDRYTKSAADGLLDTKADTTTVNAMVKSISYDKDTGTLTITEQGGSTYTIDTLLGKLAVNFTYDKQLQSLIITLSDGTVQTVPLSDFVTETEILSTDTIAVTERDGKITLDIKSGSITDEMLSSAILAAIDGYVQSCASSAASAEASAKNAKEYSDSAAGSASSALASKNAASASEQASAQSKTDATSEKLKAEGWARGTKNNVNVPSTDETYHNNSKWYSEQSALSAVAALSAQKAAEAACDQAQSIVGGNFANHTLITIPAGRMRGDIDGDGKFTEADFILISNHVSKTELLTDETQLLCADVNGDGSVKNNDKSILNKIINGLEGYYAGGFGAEVTGNWTNNPNYATEKAQFYADISITGMTTNHSASVIVKGTYENGFFPKAECVDGVIRIYAKLCPIEALTAVVSWGTGDGTAVITTESEDLTAYEKKTDAVKTAVVTIPKCRLRGDINGDGVIDDYDQYSIRYGKTSVDTISSYYNTSLTTLFPDGDIPIDFLAADVNGDNLINSTDLNNLQSSSFKAGMYAEVTGNWTANPNYETEEWQFYKDIAIDGLKTTSDGIFVINAILSNDVIKATCPSDGTMRLWIKNIALENEVSGILTYWNGTGNILSISTGIEDVTKNNKCVGISDKIYSEDLVSDYGGNKNAWTIIEDLYPYEKYDVEIECIATTSTVYDAFQDAKFSRKDRTNVFLILGTVPTVDIPIYIRVTPK